MVPVDSARASGAALPSPVRHRMRVLTSRARSIPSNTRFAPFRDQELLEAVGEALVLDARRRSAEGALLELRRRVRTLTPRELEVLRALDRGLLNKQIAYEMGIAEITVKMHRSNATRKLGARSVPDLIHKVRTLELASLPPQ
jgi:DNA-binding NarL/FixJ family response regulator